jgi:RNA polymerase sigma-70 factor (ECF subfamily)
MWDVTMAQPEGRVGQGTTAADLEEADDRTVVAAFLSGRREAFDLIVSRHRRNVYLVCYRFVGNHEDASDLVQDVFVRAFRGLAKFKNEASLGTWLYRVSVNSCLNRLAVREPDTEPVESIQRVDWRALDPLDEVVRKETAARVRQAIRKLPPKQRATLVLRMYQELPHDEIAEIMGTSVGAAKANLFHALGNLRRLLQR